MTAKTRVLLLPVLALAFVVIVVAVFYVRMLCMTDGRESFGDKREWSILQVLEDTHRNMPIADIEFPERDGYHFASLQSTLSRKRVWIMLDPHSPPFYKQLPHDDYSLSREQYDKIIATRHTTSTVEEVLSSHVR